MGVGREKEEKQLIAVQCINFSGHPSKTHQPAMFAQEIWWQSATEEMQRHCWNAVQLFCKEVQLQCLNLHKDSQFYDCPQKSHLGLFLLIC